MQLRNIRPFSQHQPGDTVEVPDGAAFDPFHYERAEPGDPPAAAPEHDAPAPPRLPIPAKEM